MNFVLPVHAISTLWLQPESTPEGHTQWVDGELHRLREQLRARVLNGTPTGDILGPAVSPWLFTTPEATSQQARDVSNISDFAAKFCCSYFNFSMADKVAFWLMLMTMLRWQILPSAETYQAIPSWYRPLAIQSFVPHMPSVDTLIWPRLREKLVKQPRDFVYPFMSSISVSWPYTDGDIFVVDEVTAAPTVRPKFKAWCFDLENWTLDAAAQQLLPECAGRVKFR